MKLQECTFKPNINKTTVSPSKKYKYYDLEKNKNHSYTRKGSLQRKRREREHYLLYGKHLEMTNGNY